MSITIHPSGFRISDRPVAVSYAQPDSFQHIDPMMRDEACVASSFGLGGAEGTWVRYWDEASTIAVLEFKDAKSIQPEPVAAPVKEKKEKKKKGESLPHSTTRLNLPLQRLLFQKCQLLQRRRLCQFQINRSR